jgi:hypothetical protein
MPNITIGTSVVHYTGSFTLTTIGGVNIPDHSRWTSHPEFINNLRSTGATVETFGDIRDWLFDNWTRLKRSTNAEFLNSGVFDILGVHLVDNTFRQAQDNATPYASRDGSWDSFIHVRVLDGGSPSFLLIPDPEPVVGEPFRVHTINRGEIRVVPPARSSSSTIESVWTTLLNYTHRGPSPQVFLSLDNERTSMYFGMELEVNTKLSCQELQLINTEVEPVREPWFYMKHDSSVQGRFDNSVEIVTVPITPRRLKKEWRIFITKLKELTEAKGETVADYFDMDTDLPNGIHIHCSNEGFVYKDRPEDSAHIRRFSTIFNQWDLANQEFFTAIAKRPNLLEHNEYCYPARSTTGYTLARRLKTPVRSSNERHAACHTGPHTTEVRIFQGIVDLKHILSCIEIVEAVIEYSRFIPKSTYGRNFKNYFNDWLQKQAGLRNAKEVVASCV